MHHAGHAHVVHELETAGRQGGQIDARDGRAEHGPLACGLPLCVGVESQFELTSGHELAVANAARCIGAGANRAVDGGQLIRRQPQALRAEPHQRLACRGRGQRQIAIVEVGRRRLAARRRALVRRPRRVALHQPDACRRHRQLLGHQLHLRGGHPLAELALAGVGRDDAIGVDADPRIEATGIHAGAVPRARLRGEGGSALEVEVDEQAAGARQELPSRDAHGCAPARLCARSA